MEFVGWLGVGHWRYFVWRAASRGQIFTSQTLMQ
jgi:hypothetical protein